MNLFLRKTNWSEDVEGLDIGAAISYVDSFDKSRPEEVIISGACHYFLESIGNYCDQEASYTVRRYIKSWDGDHGVGREGLVGRKDEKTMKKYGKTLSRLVLMVCRRCTDAKFSSMYPLPENVREASTELMTVACGRKVKESGQKIQEELLSVLSAVFCTTLHPGESRHHHVVVQFLMLSNISCHHGWLGPSFAGHVVAALQHSCRLTVLAKIRIEQDKSWSKFLEHCQFVLSNRNNSFSAMTEIMSIASTVNLSESWATPAVTWVMNGKPYHTMCIDGEVINLDDIRRGLKKHLDVVDRFFKRNLLLGLQIAEDQICAVIRGMKDNLREIQNGFGITDERYNPLLSKMRNLLVKYMLKNENVRQKFVEKVSFDKIERHIYWKEHAVREWMSNCQEFMEMFLPLIHITSGQPARG